MKVDSRNGIRGGLRGLCVRGFRFAHATVAKDAKVDTRNGLREGFITPRSQSLIKKVIRGVLRGLGVIFSLGTKKDPRGIAPRVLKQTDDSLKIISYGDESVSQQVRELQIRAGKQPRVRER